MTRCSIITRQKWSITYLSRTRQGATTKRHPCGLALRLTSSSLSEQHNTNGRANIVFEPQNHLRALIDWPNSENREPTLFPKISLMAVSEGSSDSREQEVACGGRGSCRRKR